MKKILSYIIPVIHKEKSDISGSLEVIWYKGKKQLGSQGINYSFGNLQKVLAQGLSQMNFDKSRETLLLGLGGGSVIYSLREDFDYHNKITAVELDPKAIKLAQTEFGIESGPNLLIEQADAFDYVPICLQKFGLIIIDIFINIEVPEKFFSTRFWDALITLLHSNGVVLFNAGLEPKTDKRMDTLQKRYAEKLNFRRLDSPIEHNRLWEISLK